MLPQAVCFALLASLASMFAEARLLVAPHQHVKPNQAYVVLCSSDVPLTACQIKEYSTGKLYDLSRGEETPSTGGVSYSGTGLANGQCGLSISTPSQAFLVYECRAREFDGTWNHAVSAVYVIDDRWRVLPVESGPTTVLADPGSNVTFQLLAGEPLSSCLFKWPGQTSWVSDGFNGTYPIDNRGLEAGKCTLTLTNLDQAASGFVTSYVYAKHTFNGKKGKTIHVKTLIVKAPPTAPKLTLNNATGVFKQGDVMEASCSVGAARPAARITWLLGDDVIKDDADNYDAGLEWRWEFDAQTVTQRLRRWLRAADSGKELTCRVQHPALLEGRTEVKQGITVT